MMETRFEIKYKQFLKRKKCRKDQHKIRKEGANRKVESFFNINKHLRMVKER